MLDKTPAVLNGEHVVGPSNGVVLSPEHVVEGLRGMVSEDELVRPQHALEEVQERLTEEWPNVG